MVEVADGKLMMVGADTKEATLDVAKDAQITLDGKAAKLEDLKEHTQVKVTMKEVEGKHAVTKIDGDGVITSKRLGNHREADHERGIGSSQFPPRWGGSHSRLGRHQENRVPAVAGYASNSVRTRPVPPIGYGRPRRSKISAFGSIPSRWNNVATTSFGENGFSETSPAMRSVLPTTRPRANPPPANIAE